ncbi:MAG: protein translocase subunit SecF [Ruminococcaceae bacterium]|nr:protein translocase subunit SecF [Oscillospiraceae bacterium]
MFNIVAKRSIFFIISGLVIIAGIIAMVAFGGLNTDIDFTGGTAMYVNLGAEYDEAGIRDALKGVEGVSVSSVQKTGDQEAVIKTAELATEQRVAVEEALKAKFASASIMSVDNVSATVGQELWGNAAKSILIAVVLMLIYITFRFELLSGISAVIALAHDLLVMMAIYAIFRFPVNTSFIAAMLTILGYSINATIVIFDRIRENTRFLKKETFRDIVNKSIWQSMGRSINTSLTTLLTIVMVYILGVPSIRDFALPLIIGIVAGTYSSIFIAGQFWVLFKGKDKKDIAKAKA